MARGSSRQRALLMTIGWWVVRRRLRKHAGEAVATVLAGGGLARRPQRHRLRTIIILIGLVAGGYALWRRLSGSRADDWGDWRPGDQSDAGVAPLPDAPPASAA